jgi:ankyrin repeat protein
MNKIIEILLNNGFDPDISDSKSDSAFLITVNSSLITSIKLFVEKGMDPNKVNCNGKTPLILVPTKGTRDFVFEISGYLFSKGANIHLSDKRGNNALIHNVNCSIMRNIDHTGTINFLLDNGADADKKNNIGNNALMVAIQASDTKTDIRIITSVVQILIDAKTNLDATDKTGRTALMLACKMNSPGRKEVIKMLLKGGADPNALSVKRSSTICFLLMGTNYPIDDIIKVFIDYKVDLNVGDINEKTFLMYMCENSRKNDLNGTIKFILENGADPNLKMKDGVTALQLASKNCLTTSSQKTVRILLDALGAANGMR